MLFIILAITPIKQNILDIYLSLRLTCYKGVIIIKKLVTSIRKGDKMILDIPIFFKNRLIISFDISTKEVEVMTKIINKRDAEKKAIELYEKHFGSVDNVSQGLFATDLNMILQKLNINVVIKPLAEYERLTGKSGISGVLLKNEENQYTIFIEESDSVERKRFTIAHEIAHKVLNHIGDDERVSVSYRDEFSSLGHSPEEIAANTFAAALLMPEKVIRRVYYLTSDIAMTARFLGVSDTAARYRLINLGIL